MSHRKPRKPRNEQHWRRWIQLWRTNHLVPGYVFTKSATIGRVIP
jgi:hypothetical protein